jgi:hypothetical protein
MKTALSNLVLLLSCFLVFALTARAEEQYLGTVAGGSNIVSVAANPDAGYMPLVTGFLIAPGSFLTMQNPDGGPTQVCVNAVDAGCIHPVLVPAGFPFHTKCRNLPTGYGYNYTQLDGGPGGFWQYTGCLVQSATNLDVFIRRGDER